MASRSPIQIGVEFYGDAGLASDGEVVLLMLETLRVAGLTELTLDVGHVGIYRALIQAAALGEAAEQELFDALQRKASAEIEAVLQRVSDDHTRGWLRALTRLQGDLAVLDRARVELNGAPAEVHAALDELAAIAALVQSRLSGVSLYFDLSELRGYHYHTGLVFAALVPGWGQAVANGGRYDHVGEVFGRARPATGFSTDLKALITLSQREATDGGNAIAAPCDDDLELWRVVQNLRAQGEQVIALLPGQAVAADCNRQLVLRDGRWQVVALQAPDTQSDLSNGN
jgi:ATP phosphoribosyltransferase regulatory subunit